MNCEETVYTYNALNQLLTENDISYEYDLNGNTVRMTSPDKSALYVYNAENRLIRATVQSGNNVSVEEYEYDYAGNRIVKKTEGEYTKYLLDVSGSLTYVLAEMDYDGTEKCFYTRGDELVSQERDGKKSYYVYDGHGSVRALFNEEGKITDRYTYDAFGNLISSVGSTKNDFLFAGEQFDPVTGLYYLRARYMNPSTGSFISMDSYSGSIDDPVSLHKYLYANANPVSNSDPSGYAPVSEKIDEAVIVIIILLPTAGMSAAQAKHDQAVLETGNEIIKLLKSISPLIEYASLWGFIIGAMISNVISGKMTSTEATEEIRDEIIDNSTDTKKDNNHPDPHKYYKAKCNENKIGATVYLSYSYTFEAAVKLLEYGLSDIYTYDEDDARDLCQVASGAKIGKKFVGFGPTNDNNPNSAYHYHPNIDGRTHVFFGYSDLLTFV